ncbi:MAG: hypothetical protein LUI04_05145 [Porphyromonadaceae bacterium]|nr:hypothetical protein [Porphyromonadaceae bacterium]
MSYIAPEYRPLWRVSGGVVTGSRPGNCRKWAGPDKGGKDAGITLDPAPVHGWYHFGVEKAEKDPQKHAENMP